MASALRLLQAEAAADRRSRRSRRRAAHTSCAMRSRRRSSEAKAVEQTVQEAADKQRAADRRGRTEPVRWQKKARLSPGFLRERSRVFRTRRSSTPAPSPATPRAGCIALSRKRRSCSACGMARGQQATREVRIAQPGAADAAFDEAGEEALERRRRLLDVAHAASRPACRAWRARRRRSIASLQAAEFVDQAALLRLRTAPDAAAARRCRSARPAACARWRPCR